MGKELLVVTRQKLSQLKNTYDVSKFIILGNLQDTIILIDTYGGYQKDWKCNINSILPILVK